MNEARAWGERFDAQRRIGSSRLVDKMDKF